jgi:hypothetical protein
MDLWKRTRRRRRRGSPYLLIRIYGEVTSRGCSTAIAIAIAGFCNRNS